MRVMIVGGGAREHALLWKLAQSPRVESLLCAPGNAGTEALAENLPIPGTDIDAILAAAQRERIDLVVVGPEDPLARGLADRLRAAGIPVFGPSQAATRIESSKAWSKEIMVAAGVPTARAVVVTDLAAGKLALADFDLPVVIKADGLAAGKGVVVAQTRDEAESALTAFMAEQSLGVAGQVVVIEECLIGQEVSLFGITDGDTVRTLAPACDHKRAYDGDTGPNTGGMGAYAPTRALTAAQIEEVRQTVLEPTVREMARRGAPMQGVLYAGLMLTPNGPKVLEFNARFGDPETQVVLPLLDLDLLDLCEAVARGRLRDIPQPVLPSRAAIGVVLASGGYPGSYRTGLSITGLDAVPDDLLVFHAGTKRDPAGQIVTAGGRVLTVVAQADTLAAAQQRAYEGVAGISFAGMERRSDIGWREI